MFVTFALVKDAYTRNMIPVVLSILFPKLVVDIEYKMLPNTAFATIVKYPSFATDV